MSEELSAFHSSQSGETTFKNRTDSVFGCLDVLEKKHQEIAREFDVPESNSTIKQNSRTGNRIYTRSGKRRCLPKQVPDHVLNPNNWTKYSLKDDGSYRMPKGLSAEQLNKKIAYDFLNELSQRKRNSKDETDISNDDGDGKLIFNKPRAKEDSSSSEASRSVFGQTHGGHATVMETYEVGSKKKLKNKFVEKKTIQQCSNEVKLEFREEHDEDEQSLDDENVKSKFVRGKGKTVKRCIRKRRFDEEEEDT